MSGDEIRIGSLFSGYGGLDAAALAILGEHATCGEVAS